MKTIMRYFCLLGICLLTGSPRAWAVTLFDFDGGPFHSSLPLDQTADGITAHFTATGSGFSTQQPSSVIGFTPAGFSGWCLSPNSVFASDLMVSFNTLLTGASILYAPQELATDSSCTMRITAYNGSTFVGTSTYSIDPPGTWPSGTLAISTATPFDNIVIHYDQPPPTGGDYGPIFMADNLQITPLGVPEPGRAGVMALGMAALVLGRRRIHGEARPEG